MYNMLISKRWEFQIKVALIYTKLKLRLNNLLVDHKKMIIDRINNYKNTLYISYLKKLVISIVTTKSD